MTKISNDFQTTPKKLIPYKCVQGIQRVNRAFVLRLDGQLLRT